MRLATWLLVLLGGCSACDAEHDIPPPAPPGSACELVTDSDVAVLLAGPGQRSGSPDASLCTFTRFNDSLMITVAEDASDVAKIIASDPTIYTEVALPDAQGWRMNAITMFVIATGRRAAIVTSTVNPPIDAARVETVMKAMAPRLAR